MTTGAWTLTDEGEFILDPAYKNKLDDIKRKLRERWLDTICAEVAMATEYGKDELLSEFIRRCERESGDLPIEIVDEFIIQALEGSI